MKRRVYILAHWKPKFIKDRIPFLSTPFYSSIWFHDVLISGSCEFQRMLPSLSWKHHANEMVNGCPEGWSTKAAGAVGSNYSSKDKCNSGWQKERVSLASTLPLPVLRDIRPHMMPCWASLALWEMSITRALRDASSHCCWWRNLAQTAIILLPLHFSSSTFPHILFF